MLIRSGLGVTGSQEVGVIGGTVGSSILRAAPLTGPAAPFVAAAGALVSLASAALSAFGVGNGCGPSCVTTSNDANAVEQALQANLAAYQAGQIDQATAIANYNANWQALVNACNNPSYGSAGQNCISDRAQGSCKWRDASGQCWNWYIGYYLPLLQPQVSSTASASGYPAPAPIVGSIDWGSVLLWAGLGLVAMEVL